MNYEAILALISDLYVQIAQQRQEIERLNALLPEKQPEAEPDVQR